MPLVTLTKDNFNEEVQKYEIAVLDFWAPWCAPCRQFAPIFEEVAKEYPDILFGKINTEEEQELAAYFQIRSIPTVMVIKEGVVVFAQPGLLPKEALKDIIKQAQELDMEKVKAEMEKEQQNQQQQEDSK